MAFAKFMGDFLGSLRYLLLVSQDYSYTGHLKPILLFSDPELQASKQLSTLLLFTGRNLRAAAAFGL